MTRSPAAPEVEEVDEGREELLGLVRQIRAQLARHAASGTWAAPAGANTRGAGSACSGVVIRGEDAGASEVEVAVAAPSLGVVLVSEISRPLPAPSVDLAAAPGPAASPPASSRRSLAEVRAELGSCTRCKLHATRATLVFGTGPADAALMLVGEAPGEQEDLAGEPFVGRAGHLLDQMLEAAGLPRSQVYVTNTLKCRPPRNRNPQLDELLQCRPFLHAQIAAVRPRVVVALGRPAANELLGTDAPISSLRGRVHEYARASGGVRVVVVPTFHPAYLLREPGKRALAEADLGLALAELARGARPSLVPGSAW